jgi:mRNA-degrading endonuclease RelE of RelBE toxin-antitoxin system
MQFLIADTFTSSLGKLTDTEQKQVKTSAFDMQMNPANPGFQFHKLNAARDPNFWSVRVNRDIRIVVHRSESRLLLCYVDHHDDAYKWGERRKLETHPKTGAAQLVEVRETVKEIVVPTYVGTDSSITSSTPALASVTAEQLLQYGVPEDWITDLLKADEDQILELVDHLPAEASEAVLELATGGLPRIPEKPQSDHDPFDHPDSFRRFRVVEDADELTMALDYPWEKWAVFLHPAQSNLVKKEFNGPARISGSAGTGKTIVALHRAVHLARKHPDARILLTTFSDPLARNLLSKIRILCASDPRLMERIEVASLDKLAARLSKHVQINDLIPDKFELFKDLENTLDKNDYSNIGSSRFIINEWMEVVDAWQITNWESYRDFKRLGRKIRLTETKRKQLWDIFVEFESVIHDKGWITRAAQLKKLSEKYMERKRAPYDFIVVDEAQDITPMQLNFVGAFASQGKDNLFFTGDLGQRIFQTPFSWASLGVEIRGRSHSLKINYRTSHQIRRQADRLLNNKISDVDGNEEDRSGTVSVFNGPNPVITVCDNVNSESGIVAGWIKNQVEAGATPGEIGIFVRSDDEVNRAEAVAKILDMPFVVLDESKDKRGEMITISTMHLAKGLEFRYVVVMACDDEVIPSQSRIERVTDMSDLEEVYNTERHLLYVACTRARDGLIITGVSPESEFLADIEW